jgi:hypothetical protein
MSTMRTWLCVLGSGPGVHIRDSRANRLNLRICSAFCVETRRHNNEFEFGEIDESDRHVSSKGRETRLPRWDRG